MHTNRRNHKLLTVTRGPFRPISSFKNRRLVLSLAAQGTFRDNCATPASYLGKYLEKKMQLQPLFMGSSRCASSARGSRTPQNRRALHVLLSWCRRWPPDCGSSIPRSLSPSANWPSSSSWPPPSSWPPCSQTRCARWASANSRHGWRNCGAPSVAHLSLVCPSLANWANCLYTQPFVDTMHVETVRAWQHFLHVTLDKVGHANYAHTSLGRLRL